MPVIPGLESVYFPSFPYPADGIVVPLDENNQAIIQDDIPIYAVLMPYCYCKLIIEFANKTETAVTALQAVEHPP